MSFAKAFITERSADLEAGWRQAKNHYHEVDRHQHNAREWDVDPATPKRRNNAEKELAAEQFDVECLLQAQVERRIELGFGERKNTE